METAVYARTAATDITDAQGNVLVAAGTDLGDAESSGSHPSASPGSRSAPCSMEVHPFAFIFCKNILNIYYMFLMYHLMGYVLLQYHLELGYSVDYEDFEDIGKNEYDTPEESSPEVIRIELLLQEGQLPSLSMVACAVEVRSALSEPGIRRSPCYIRLGRASVPLANNTIERSTRGKLSAIKLIILRTSP